jgi:DNA-binding transcriptional ArsR family regulator
VSRSTAVPPPERRPVRRTGRGALRRDVRKLARAFAEQLLGLLERHGVWDEPRAAPAIEPSQRRVRRSMDALGRVADRVLADLRARKEPVAISEIAAALGASARQLSHPLALLVAEGKVTLTGERRGARYQLAGRARGRRRRKR